MRHPFEFFPHGNEVPFFLTNRDINVREGIFFPPSHIFIVVGLDSVATTSVKMIVFRGGRDWPHSVA